MIPEIWSTTDRIFSDLDHFFTFTLPTPIPPLPLLNNPKNQKFEKIKKA